MKNKTIRLLMLEDNADDALLIKAALKQSALNFDMQLVDEKACFIAALDSFCPDIVLSDHQLPQFGSVEALEITRNKMPHIPFILVTGTVSEAFAANIIKWGADDYILKDRLTRLPSAIDAALKKRWAERDKEEAEKKAAEQKEFDNSNLRALINNTNDLMWSVDKDFTLITFNDAFDKIVELMSGKRITKGENLLTNQFTEEQINYFRKHYKRAFDGETFTEVIHNETPIDFWSEISFYPIFKEQEVIGTACFSRNITERKLIEIERRKITSDLLQRNKDLEQFTYIVSHNLRAPLANIKGLIDVLNMNQQTCPENEELLKMLAISSEKMDEVVMDLNNILSTRNEIKETKESVKFSLLTNDIIESLKHTIDLKKISIEMDFSAIDNLFSRKAFLYSIFYNLITNSIKYSKQDTPLCILIKSAMSADAVTLLFCDNGLGIDLIKNQGKVFGLYKRFHNHVDGKGLGLFMVKTQVEALNGTIAVESEVNQGTTFEIVLPIANHI